MERVLKNTGNRLLDRLSNSDFAALKDFIKPVNCHQNEVIVEPGSRVDFVYFPAGAVLSVVTVMEAGQGVEACTIGFESAYGLLNALGAPDATERVVAQIPGPAARISTARLRAAAAASPSLAEAMVRYSQATQIQMQHSVACNAVHNVEARLCRWLLMSADRSGSDKLPLTQEYLGYMLGVQRTTVTGAARSLQDAGLIRYVRGQIDIVNRRGLEDGACECYGVVLEKQNLILGLPPRSG